MEGNNKTRKLYRSKKDRYIGGVCGGLAAYTGLDSNLVRLLMAIGVFVAGIGFILYIAALIIVPENPGEENVERPLPVDNTTFWGIVFIVLGAVLLFWELDWFDLFYIDLPWTTIWALLLIAGGGALIYRQYQKEQDSDTMDLSTEVSDDDSEPAPKRNQFDIYRSRTDRKISGVCAGLAKHFNVDPALVRLGWVVLTIASKGLGVLIYIALVFILPEESSEQAV